MDDRFDVNELYEEIKEDEKLDHVPKKKILTQESIQKLIEKKKKGKGQQK
jgi:hypothetical protein